MTTRRDLLSGAPAAGALLALGASERPTPARAQTTMDTGPDWRCQSLVDQPAEGANGVVAAADTLTVNERMGAASKGVYEVAPGIWQMRGWGIGHVMAIDAPEGWIIIDTGDTTQAAAEMRAMLEEAVGGPIRVAAILITHWHYANGQGAFLDEGTQTWGHELLDANRTAEAGLSPFIGVAQSRAIAQFGILHPRTGPDAFPNVLGFGPEKLSGDSSYQPPMNTFPDGQIVQITVAGEDIEVAPNRSDTTDSVGFWFPARKLLVTNFMVTPVIFNIFTLRGGTFRDPTVMIDDARWLESKDAEVLLDIHNAPLLGGTEIRAAIERNSDQLKQIWDQTIRLIAQGYDARQAAEAIAMSPSLRGGAELYGQVESHVRAVWANRRGWFGWDVYDINPLSEREEAARLLAAMGGVEAVREAAAQAVAEGGIDNWRWGLKQTSLLLALDPDDQAARATRADAARAMGQRTTSANARGFYITEALQIEGEMQFDGQPVTVDLLRRVLGTPRREVLVAASPAGVLDYLAFLVDPRAAGDRRVTFTLAVEGDPALHRLQLRNGVLIRAAATEPGPIHVTATPDDLADFVLGTAPLPSEASELADFRRIFDRSHFLDRDALVATLSKTPTYPY